nr:MAG TPA: hypothetical protein [Caudoviricetes sp.]
MEIVSSYIQFGKKALARELYFLRKAIYLNHLLQLAPATVFRYGPRAHKKRTCQYFKIIQLVWKAQSQFQFLRYGKVS